MVYSLENTLNSYHNLSINAQYKSKNERPILVIRTINGERQIHLVENRSDLSLFTRLKAFFGFGNASLKNVATVLRQRQWNNWTEQLNQSITYIDSKIAAFNKASFIQKIAPIILLKPVVISEYNSGVSASYYLEGPAEGILDFVHVFPEIGAAYVADATGHNKPPKHKKLKEYLWDIFNEKFVLDYKQANIKTLVELNRFLKNYLLNNLNVWAETAGTASTFSFAMIVELEGKKQVVSMHVGDSTLIHVNRQGEIKHLTPNKDPVNQLELSALNHQSPVFMDVTPVEAGDKIFGLTDGITDFLPDEILNAILQHYQPANSDSLIGRLEIAIQNLKNEKEVHPGKKPFNENDKNGSDDLGAFVLVVPD